MNQILTQYVTPAASETLKGLYTEISKSYRKPAPGEEKDLQEQLTVRLFLWPSIRYTC